MNAPSIEEADWLRHIRPEFRSQFLDYRVTVSREFRSQNYGHGPDRRWSLTWSGDANELSLEAMDVPVDGPT